jgi:hypothetical protein
MTVPEQTPACEEKDRFARLDALYETYLRNVDTQQAAPGDEMNEDIVEIACEFAPSVRRRFNRRNPH